MSNPAIMIYVPFALNGNKNIIQVTRQENQDQEDATWSSGYPDITMIKQSAGGKAPKGLDMNGVLYSLSADIVHRQSGKQMLFDAEYATNIGGYAKGSLLQSTDLSRFWISTVDGNTTDPDSASSSGWNRFAYTPVATSTTTGTVKLVNSLASTATDTALTAAQGKVLNDIIYNGYANYNGWNWSGRILIQWGSGRGSDGDMISFPIKFPENVFVVSITDNDGSTTHGYEKSSTNTSQFKLKTTSPYINYSYIAIGN